MLRPLTESKSRSLEAHIVSLNIFKSASRNRVDARVMSDDCEFSKFIDQKSEDMMTVMAKPGPKEPGVFLRATFV